MTSIEDEKIKLIQDIGKEICEDCGPGRDCDIEIEDCIRISNALIMLDSFHIRL